MGGRGARVNGLSPGPIETGGFRESQGETSGEAERTGNAGPRPPRSYGEAGRDASAALFLATDESSFVTGRELHVDGRMTIRRPACRRSCGRHLGVSRARGDREARKVVLPVRQEGAPYAGPTATVAAAEWRDLVNGQRAPADTEWNASVSRRTSATVVADSDRQRASVAS
ncbi:SDR family oxidoreductase [Streptomyces sp. NPDC002793]|uniref:SDR family oxidoreductase n=1 Tax=Streptomyces sp. gb1(2016) TaxID=1828321 RepID=A0A652KLF9_9ACTN|nr:SDR family oxidoreductase [Streptomyces sp. NEAU-H3]TXS24406.1 SDR family oxidoreductase [Streptomyces sp. gb1(2016)]